MTPAEIATLAINAVSGLVPVVANAIADHGKSLEEVRAEALAAVEAMIADLGKLREQVQADDQAAIDAAVAGQ